jgi:glutaredoxin
MTEVEFITMPGCVQCAKAKAVIEKVKPDFSDMRVTYLDATEHPELIEKYKIMSAPGIIIDGDLAFTGGVSEAALRERLTTRSSKPPQARL